MAEDQKPNETAEETIKKFIMYKYGYGYDSHRELLVVPVYGNNGQLSTLVIQVSGSPPKGTLYVEMSDFYDGEPEWIGFHGHGRKFQTIYRHEEGYRGKEIAAIIPKLLKEHNIAMKN
ncbi:hypothetical protein [Tardisphaera saccharovorans]